ncbi:MAG: CPBP family intramembrane metalloprotease [Chloracidobacterium sp.]|nr:CPBP family intramembrane metalloprotease [Chloracidobacterium sp.]
MQRLFIDSEGIVRSGWRATLFLVTYLIVAGGVILASLGIAGRFSPGGSLLRLFVTFTIAAAVAIVLGWLCGRYFERVPFGELGCTFSGRWLRNLVVGLAVGGAAFISAVFVALLGRGLTFTINTTSSGVAIGWTLLATLAVFAAGAASEETLFRGYFLQTFARSRLSWLGVIVTSMLFAFAHNDNPSADPLAILNTLLAGAWFATAYFKTRDLWFPFGVHLAWNWLQGPIFGINVSGIAEFSPDPVLRAIDSGPAWLTGGSYGIEGGIACTIALVISVGLIYFLPLKANHIET